MQINFYSNMPRVKRGIKKKKKKHPFLKTGVVKSEGKTQTSDTQEGTNGVAVVLIAGVDVTIVHIYDTSVVTTVLARTPEVATSNQRATIRKS